MSNVVMSYIRANPPTIGHEKLYQKMLEVAKQLGPDTKTFLLISPKQDSKKNPLDHMTRVHLLRFAGINVETARCSDFFDAVRHVSECTRYNHLHVVVGEDRYTEMQRKLDFYNGIEYNFKSITIHSSGERDPDSEGVSGISGTKMREFVRLGQTYNFANGLPEKLRPRAEEIERMVRNGLGL